MQYEFDVGQVFGPGVREHDDVVHVDSSEFPHVLERHVHGSLEGAGRVGQPKWHYKPLERISLGLEGRIVYVLPGLADLVEARAQVPFREEFCPSILSIETSTRGVG